MTRVRSSRSFFANRPTNIFVARILFYLKKASDSHIHDGVNAEKQYSLETENRGYYLYAIVGGLKVTPEIALSYWPKIVDECDELGLSKILLEHNFVEMISVEGMLEVMGPLGDLLTGRSFAFIDRYGHYEVPEAAKAILRGKNIKMQLFKDIHKAEKWLLAN